MERQPEVPSLVGFGWDEGEDGNFIIKWNTVNPAPDEVLDMMFCSCPRKCISGSCPCIDNSLSCTHACTKQLCENFPDLDFHDIASDGNDFDNSSDEKDF